MSNIFVPPISIHFIVDTKHEKLSELRYNLYKMLCRDPEDPTFDGIDIPVYFHIGGDNKAMPSIEAIASSKHIIVPIIDSQMYLDEYWGSCLPQILDLVKNNPDKFVLMPVQECEEAFDICDGIGDIQFISIKDDKKKPVSILNAPVEFQIRFFTFLIKQLIKGEDDTQLTLFLSHSKCDKDQSGVNHAKEFRQYISNETKLQKFFDANDISDGKNFKEELINGVKDSIFVLFSSDTYSNREWCRKEVLQSKFHNVPIVRVDVTTGSCDRIFPYMANSPSIRFNGGKWDEVIALILRTALDHHYQDAFLKSLLQIKETERKIGVEPIVPELLGVHYHHEDSDIVLYPEPPVGEEELEVLKHSFGNKLFLTPMQLFTNGLDLHGMKVGISISEPNDFNGLPIGEEMFHDVFIEVARHILAANGTLVYGGDLRKERGFTRQLGDLAYQYAASKGSGPDVKYIYNFFAWPIHNSVDKQEELFLKKHRIQSERCDSPSGCDPNLKNIKLEDLWLDSPILFARSLTLMRENRTRFSDSAIVIGGKTRDFKGFIPGIIEEAYLTLNEKKPLFIVGAFGGATMILAKLLQKKISIQEALTEIQVDPSLLSQCEQSGVNISTEEYLRRFYESDINALKNGLFDEENEILFTSTSVIEIVALILKGLDNINKKKADE